jgi:predicted rRNA methylase YqxC with S4 and FtsJ domains
MHDEVIERVRNAAVDLGLVDRGCIPSPIDGGDGNQEWLLVLDRPADVRHM